MGNKKILSFAVLGTALVTLISAAEGNALQPELIGLKADFDSLQLETETQVQDQLAQSNQVINELKEQLADALDIKENSTDLLTVTVDKVKYFINHGSYPYSREQIAESPQIAKDILKIKGQNAISKL